MKKVEDQCKEFQPQGEFELFSIYNSQPKRKIKVWQGPSPHVYKEACKILIEFQAIYS